MIALSKENTLKETIDSVNVYSSKFNIPANLVYAVITKESQGNPDKIIHEPHFFDRYRIIISNLLSIKYEKEKQTVLYLRCSSFGLMQIMHQVAVEHGFDKDLPPAQLLDINFNVFYGVKILSHRIGRYGLERGISAYNAGSPTSANYKDYTKKVLDIKYMLDHNQITPEECLKSYYIYQPELVRILG